MKILYVSKYYDRTYRNAGIGGIMLENGEVVRVYQKRYFEISEINAELMAFIDIIGSLSKEERHETCVIFPAGRIRKIGIKNILKSVEKGGDDEIREKFAPFYNDMKEVLIIMSDDKDARNSEWFKYCYRLAFLSWKGVVRDGVVDLILKYSKMSANKLYEKIQIIDQSVEINRAERISEIRKNMRTRKTIFMVMRSGPHHTEPDFATFDEEFAKEYVKRKMTYFKVNKNALNHYQYCMTYVTAEHPSAVTEEMLNGSGITLERFRRISEETVNGRFNEWYIIQVPIKNEI